MYWSLICNNNTTVKVIVKDFLSLVMFCLYIDTLFDQLFPDMMMRPGTISKDCCSLARNGNIIFC